MKIFQSLGIPGSIWGVSTAVLLMAVSISMTFSISPFFMTNVLGLSLVSMGVIEGLSEGLSQISRLFSGIVSDFSRRKKPTLLVGFLIAIISKPFFILANGTGLVVASKLLERLSNGIMATPRDAFVADEAPTKHKGACLGVLMTFKTLGCVLGSWLIAMLLWFTDDYRMLLWLGFVAAVLSILVLYLFMREKPLAEEAADEATGASSSLETISENPQKKTTKEERFKLSWQDIRSLSWRYWSVLAIAGVFMCARFSDGFLILRMKELGASTSLCASIIGTFNIISALCCFPVGRWSDRIDRSAHVVLSFYCLGDL